VGAWFWDTQWQSGEREVDEHIRTGRSTRFESADDLLLGLDAPNLDEK